MSAQLQRTLDHLKALVAIDSQNPPRGLRADGPLTDYLVQSLPGFEFSVHDEKDGSITYDAVRGDPSLLFNVHLDTVPATHGWSTDPFTLQVGGDVAVGLGACDIKGAAAILLTLAEATDAPMRLLFTTDEEAGQGRCVRSFLERGGLPARVVVGEPTEAKAVTAHRGITTARRSFEAAGGHASSTGAPSAVHEAAAWITSALAHPSAEGMRLNVGRIEGGLKPNMVAAHAEVLFGFRQRPGSSPEEFLAAIAPRGNRTETWQELGFSGPSLPSTDEGVTRQEEMAAWAKGAGVSLGEPVDFWTEASLFSAAGVPAMVLGPGSIAQAHQVNEWVALSSLTDTIVAYEKLIEHG